MLFVHLKGSFDVIAKRLENRKGHFMPPSLLQSQLEILEEPDDTENHLTVDITGSVESIVDVILKYHAN